MSRMMRRNVNYRAFPQRTSVRLVLTVFCATARAQALRRHDYRKCVWCASRGGGKSRRRDSSVRASNRGTADRVRRSGVARQPCREADGRGPRFRSREARRALPLLRSLWIRSSSRRGCHRTRRQTPGNDPVSMSRAQDSVVIPALRSRSSDIAFSRVRPRIRTHSVASLGTAARKRAFIVKTSYFRMPLAWPLGPAPWD